MSKSWAGVAHSQQRGSDTHRSPASQETREAWRSRVHPTGAGAGLGSRHGERITQEQKRKEEEEEQDQGPEQEQGQEDTVQLSSLKGKPAGQPLSALQPGKPKHRRQGITSLKGKPAG
mgnify:FL=1